MRRKDTPLDQTGSPPTSFRSHCSLPSRRTAWRLAVTVICLINLSRVRADSQAIHFIDVTETAGAIEDDANDIAVRCVGNEPVILTLTAGGRDVATVRDAAGIKEGNVGVRLGTAESVVTCSFREFELRSL